MLDQTDNEIAQLENGISSSTTSLHFLLSPQNKQISFLFRIESNFFFIFQLNLIEFHGQTHSIFPPSVVKEDLTFFLDLIDEASKIAKENPIDIFNVTESTASISSENKEEGAISLQVGAPWSSLGLQFRKLRISQLRNQQQGVQSFPFHS